MSLSNDIKFVIDLIDDAITEGGSTLDAISDYKVDIKELINMVTEFGADFGDELIDLKDVVLSIL